MMPDGSAYFGVWVPVSKATAFGNTVKRVELESAISKNTPDGPWNISVFNRKPLSHLKEWTWTPIEVSLIDNKTWGRGV